MSSSNSIGAPYLPTSKSFLGSLEDTQTELGKTYIEIARTINSRTIGIFNTFQIVTGDQYFSNGVPGATSSNSTRQSYRQAYMLGSVATGATTTIPHGINGLTQIVHLYGNCIATPSATPNAIYRPLPFVDCTNVTYCTALYMDNSNIYVQNGAGADAIVSGTIIVEYLLN